MAVTLETLAARVEALERAQTATPVSYYTSKYSGEEMDERLDAAGVLGGSTPQQALANLGAGVRAGLGINMDFSIDQRGKGPYTSSGYTLDGWAAAPAAAGGLASFSVAFDDPGITISAAGSDMAYLDLIQYLEGDFGGKTLTFSVLYGDGAFLTATGTVPEETPSSVTTFATKIDPGGGIWIRRSNNGMVLVQIRTNAGYTQSVLCAKLEEGDGQTLAWQDNAGGWHRIPQPEDGDYAGMLARCQRYLYNPITRAGPVAPVGYGFANSATSAIIYIPTPTMRSGVDSVLLQSGTFYIESTAGAGGNAIPVTNLAINVQSDNAVKLLASGAGFPTGQGVGLQARDAGAAMLFSRQL